MILRSDRFDPADRPRTVRCENPLMEECAMVLRSDRFDPDEPENMDAEERRDELASIFARGILRLHGRVPAHFAPIEILPNSSPTCLELSATSSPDRTTG